MSSSLEFRNRAAKNKFIVEYFNKKFDLNYDRNDTLFLEENYSNIYRVSFEPSDLTPRSEAAYDNYFKDYLSKNPNENRRFREKIEEFKKKLEIAKSKKEKFKKYLIEQYSLTDDLIFEKLLYEIINRYLFYSKRNFKYINIDVFLRDSDIQNEINPIIQRYKKMQTEIGEIKQIKQTVFSITKKGPSEKNKELYKIAEEMILKEELNLDVKISQANDKLKELSGLDNDEIESVINDVMIIIKQNINNKKEELKLKEQIIQILNPVQTETKDLIDLMD